MGIILGIDPGSRITGYGLVYAEGSRLSLVASGTIKAYTGESSTFPERLVKIYEKLSSVIAEYSPDAAAIESLFFAKNAMSALKLGHARGAAMLAAAHGGLKVYEYSPLEIKQSVTGYGKAEKEQIRHMVSLLLNIRKDASYDESDALAAAICHASNRRMETKTGGNPRNLSVATGYALGK